MSKRYGRGLRQTTGVPSVDGDNGVDDDEEKRAARSLRTGPGSSGREWENLTWVVWSSRGNAIKHPPEMTAVRGPWVDLASRDAVLSVKFGRTHLEFYGR
jgi:hypothetical protein